jgi:hypothetical protein
MFSRNTDMKKAAIIWIFLLITQRGISRSEMNGFASTTTVSDFIELTPGDVWYGEEEHINERNVMQQKGICRSVKGGMTVCRPATPGMHPAPQSEQKSHNYGHLCRNPFTSFTFINRFPTAWSGEVLSFYTE